MFFTGTADIWQYDIACNSSSSYQDTLGIWVFIYKGSLRDTKTEYYTAAK